MNRRLNRRLALFFAALALGLVVVRLMFVQGLTTIVRIDGGSMAESLPGEHVAIVCPQCSRRWQCDAVQWDATTHHTCPQCGDTFDEVASVVRHLATRVVIDRAAYWFAKPQRFDVVAFKPPNATNELAVKRIVALPGERWEIRGGDLFVDEQRLKKSYAQFREVALLVHQWNKTTSSSSPAWQGADSEGWGFHHQSNRSSVQDREIPVQDYDAYNPALTRPLNEVIDIVGQAELQGDRQHLLLKIHDGYDVLGIDYDEAAGKVVARRGDREITRAKVYGDLRDQRQMVWGVWDRQLFLVVNDQVVLRHALEEKSEPPQAVSRPLGIQAEAGELRLRSLQVFRDVYYLDPRGLDAKWRPSTPPSAEEYAVLGDNPPLSMDSRHWDDAIPRNTILGKVLRR